jgi:hypothetical protein
MSEDTFNPDDSVFDALFTEAGWKDVAKAPPNERRVEEITQRAISETIVKDSSSFLFLGFAAALTGFFCAFFGSVGNNDEDYKP